jgi:hypothetical protein
VIGVAQSLLEDQPELRLVIYEKDVQSHGFPPRFSRGPGTESTANVVVERGAAPIHTDTVLIRPRGAAKDN